MRLVLEGGTVLICDAERRVLSEGSVVIEDGRIVSVGEALRLDLPSEERVDCRGCVVMPGLVNSHVHLGEQLFKGLLEDVDFEGVFYSTLFAWEGRLTPQLVRRASLAAAVESLRCGVTTIADMYHHADATAKAVQAVGIRAVLGQKVLGFSLGRPPVASADGVDYRFDRGAFRDQLAAACEFADRANGTASGRITTALCPHATNTLEPWMLERVAEEADRRSLRVHMHVAQMESERDDVAARSGMGCIEILDSTGLLTERLLAAHAIFVSESEVKQLSSRRVGVAHNPVANAKDGGLVAPVHLFRAQGVEIALGTDAFHMNLLETARFAVYLHRVRAGDARFVSPEDVLEWATLGGARALGMSDEIGSLEPGKRADLLVVDLQALNLVPWHNPTAAVLYHADPRNLRLVMVDGRVVVENGTVSTVDAAEVSREFASAADEVQRRIGVGGGR